MTGDPSLTSTATDQLDALHAALQQFDAGELSAQALSTQARAQGDLLAALPPQFETVLLQLLDRLESSALFSEESCSFSQKDLLDSLRLWADKARAKL
ncbi:MAG: hypothetical protein ACN6O3_19785 [Comamonas sp.]